VDAEAQRRIPQCPISSGRPGPFSGARSLPRSPTAWIRAPSAIRADRAARVTVAARASACAVRGNVGGERKQLFVEAVPLDQVGDPVSSNALAFRALNPQHVKFANCGRQGGPVSRPQPSLEYALINPCRNLRAVAKEASRPPWVARPSPRHAGGASVGAFIIDCATGKVGPLIRQGPTFHCLENGRARRSHATLLHALKTEGLFRPA
jgi:hypothetical protein